MGGIWNLRATIIRTVSLFTAGNLVILSGGIAPRFSLASEPDLLLCARYSIWLDNQDSALDEYNLYTIKRYRVDRSVKGQERMLFALPMDLVGGKKIPIELKVVMVEGLDRIFSGKMGTAQCRGTWTEMACAFRFNNLYLNPVTSLNYLQMKYGANARTDGLMHLAIRFGGDPVGVAAMTPMDSHCL